MRYHDGKGFSVLTYKNGTSRLRKINLLDFYFNKTNNPNVLRKRKKFELLQFGWGSWIRTNECQSQSLMPYRLAIPQFHLFTCVILSNFSIFCKHFAMPFLTFFQIRQKRPISLVFSVLPASMIEYIPSSHTEVSSCYSAKS